MGRYTDEEIADLTDEEREALLGDEDEDSNQDEDEGGTAGRSGDDERGSDGTDSGADDDGTAGDEAGGDEGDVASASADDEGDDGGKGEVEGQTNQRPHPAPILTADGPDDADERLAEIASEKEKLIERFDDGELTAKEYQIELDKLAKQEREIEQAVFKANIAREMAEQQARNEWMATVNRFLDAHPAYRSSKLMYQTLDAAVRELAAQPENEKLTGDEILSRAHSRIMEEFGLKEENPAKGGGKPAGTKREKQRIDVPPTLAKVPASDMTEMEHGRWAKLDRLMETDPERYEAELAKLTDADREAYLMSQ